MRNYGYSGIPAWVQVPALKCLFQYSALKRTVSDFAHRIHVPNSSVLLSSKDYKFSQQFVLFCWEVEGKEEDVKCGGTCKARLILESVMAGLLILTHEV